MLKIRLLPTQKLHIKMNSVSARTIIRKDAINKKGEMPLSIQCFVNSKRIVIPLHISVEPKFYDEKAQKIKASHTLALEYNSTITAALYRAAEIKAEADKRNEALTKETFRAKFMSVTDEVDFIQYWEQELEKRRKNNDIDHNTWKGHRSVFRKFKECKKYLAVATINVQTLYDFEAFLRNDKKNDVNTVGKGLSILRTYINRLMNVYDVQMKNPFVKFKIKKAQTHRQFLTQQEVYKMHNLYIKRELSPALQQSLLLYMTGVFLSPRISDIRKIRAKASGALEKGEITIEPTKTRKYKKRTKLPLTEPAKFYLRELSRFRGKIKADQNINWDLKIIAQQVGINKPISFHSSRHTFATMFLRLGGKIEVLREILGHSDIKTTMIYTHILDESISEQMQNFNKLNLNYGTI